MVSCDQATVDPGSGARIHMHTPLHGSPTNCGTWRGSDDHGAIRDLGRPRTPGCPQRQGHRLL